MHYFEDLAIGQSWRPGTVTFTAEEIRDFAEAFDPQPIHLDEAAGREHFGGLIASGWHTAAACMRPLATDVLDDIAVIAALGIDELRWRKPVRPGDELAVETTLVGLDPWDDHRGKVTFRLEAYNQHDELVHDRTEMVLVERRV